MFNFTKNNNKKASDKKSKDPIIVVAVLLNKLSSVDDKIDPLEQDYIAKALCDYFHVKKEDVLAIINNSKDVADQTVDLYSDTKFLRDTMSYEQRLDILKLLWGMVIADKNIDDDETYFMNKVCQLLYIDSVDHANIKDEAKSKL